MGQETFHDLLKLIESYVVDELKVAYFSVLAESTVNNQPGLQTIWSTREERLAYSVNKENGYATHSAYVFGENKPLWIVSGSKEPLQKTQDYQDLWSGSEDLPQYNTSIQNDVRTSVMHPLTVAGRPVGVVEFATEAYVEPTPATLEEARLLAAVIARAYQLVEVREAQRENTRQAIRMLEESRQRESWTRLALPQIFVAHPGTERLRGKAKTDHEEVITTIHTVIGEFKHKLKIVLWDKITKTGSINAQVIDEITGSDFGLAYFSEPLKGGTFQDNPNVLFEAGMMQALSNAPGALFKGWIPIREKASPPIPFDIANERILWVDRADDGSLDSKIFAKNLRGWIKDLIGEA
jgi:hypothetical protein